VYKKEGTQILTPRKNMLHRLIVERNDVTQVDQQSRLKHENKSDLHH